MAKRPRKSELDKEIQGLYALPLGEFTAARNALAARLRKAGDAAASDEVKALAKPSPSAWAVNVLLQRESGRMQELLEAGEQARTAQRKAVTGGGAGTLRDALQAERDLRDELRRRAAEILEEDGGKASQAMLDRVAANLDAIALSPDTAEAAERGWIDRDLDPPGFEVFAGVQFTAKPRQLKLVPPPKETPKKASESTRQASKAEEARKRQEEAERARREREEATERERLTRLATRLAEAQADADTVHREVERLEKALADAEHAAAEARRRVESLRQDAGRARQRAERAEDKLARARKDYDAAR
ncbi:MAG TPA: hypothetical protein VMW27_13145 [Thermoanaerobaculia bacterium]|nr:hypothetical protein [Thermoanaerobaculia bacterium]